MSRTPSPQQLARLQALALAAGLDPRDVASALELAHTGTPADLDHWLALRCGQVAPEQPILPFQPKDVAGTLHRGQWRGVPFASTPVAGAPDGYAARLGRADDGRALRALAAEIRGVNDARRDAHRGQASDGQKRRAKIAAQRGTWHKSGGYSAG